MVIADLVGQGLGSGWAPLLAFAAGVISFASPCVLPLVPGYLSFMAGEGATAGDRPTLLPVVLFILGFTVVFTVIFGAAASELSRWLREPPGQRFAGGVVLVFGLAMVAYALRLRVPWLYRERRPLLSRVRPGAVGAFPLGMAFAVGWTPCIGPVLGGILTLAASRGTTVGTVMLLFIYSLGLGVPFLLVGMGIRRSLVSFRVLARNYRWIAGGGGVILIAIGVLLVTGAWVTLLAPILHLINRFTPPI